jgi:hypothetical protein
MDALFVIPTLVSPNVPDRLIPGISKMVERNIVLTYSSTIRIAALRKYAHIFKSSTVEGALSEGPNSQSGGNTGIGVGYSDEDGFNVDLKTSFDPSTLTGSSREIEGSDKIKKISANDIELPRGISFFNTVSLEPTYLEIPINQKKGLMGFTGTSERWIKIGFKCIPYRLEGMTDIKNAIINNRQVKNYVRRRFDTFVKKNFKSGMYTGRKSSGDIVTDVIAGPSIEDLSNPNILASVMNTREPSRWTSLSMFTTFDFEDSELKEIMTQYRQIVKSGWGDIVIINENRESVSFCTTKMLACYEFPYNYLRQIMNMDSAMDYRELKSGTRPFNIVPLRTAFKESIRQVSETSDFKVNLHKLFE